MIKIIFSRILGGSVFLVPLLIGVLNTCSAIAVASFCEHIFDWNFKVILVISILGMFTDSILFYLAAFISSVANIFIFWGEGEIRFWASFIWISAILIVLFIQFIISLLVTNKKKEVSSVENDFEKNYDEIDEDYD